MQSARSFADHEGVAVGVLMRASPGSPLQVPVIKSADGDPHGLACSMQ
jgi:hypothetical protein